ncbi:MAG: SHOCT domain-containing protein [Planctomycetes bacterium]|nr:SHOCT domain-containing protein [Planctomycetota bacterium]
MTITTTQVDAAREITEKCGYAAAALTILPIPGSEIIGVMPLHVGMVVKIGHIYGVDLDRDSATQLIIRIGATVGLSLVGSRLATTAAKLILPGLGGLISAPFMYASTLAIGRVAECYFQRQGGLSDHEMKAVFEETLRKAKKSFDPRRARGDDARRHAEEAVSPAPAQDDEPTAKLERLAKLRDAGVLTPEEFEAAKRRILDAL